MKHDLVKTGDADAHGSLVDRNGEVVLAYCRRCRKGEAELGLECVQEPIAPTSDAGCHDSLSIGSQTVFARTWTRHPALRWRRTPGASDVLEQAWQCIETHAVEWRAVEIVDDNGQ
jgi:hypothetical protein